jgi:hypothetical protein
MAPSDRIGALMSASGSAASHAAKDFRHETRIEARDEFL